MIVSCAPRKAGRPNTELSRESASGAWPDSGLRAAETDMRVGLSDEGSRRHPLRSMVGWTSTTNGRRLQQTYCPIRAVTSPLVDSVPGESASDAAGAKRWRRILDGVGVGQVDRPVGRGLGLPV